MTNLKKTLLLLLLVLAGMACSLTEGSNAMTGETPTPTRTPAGSVSKIAPVAVLATPSPTSSPVCIVAAHALTLRAGPGIDFHALDYLAQGDALTVLDNAAGWWKVTTQTGKTGYINSTYCNDPAQ